MALSKLQNLYRQVILDHSSHPRNFGELENANGSLELNNPTCGDVIMLQVYINDGIIEQAKFSGHGCSISTASASMMTELVIGETMEEAKEKIEEFLLLVQAKIDPDETELGDAVVLEGVAKFPARIKCATLSWKALERVILREEATTNETKETEKEENDHE